MRMRIPSHTVYIITRSVNGTASYNWDVIEYTPVNNFWFQKVRVLCMLLDLYYGNSGIARKLA